MIKAGFVGRKESSQERGSGPQEKGNKRKANGRSRSDEPREGESRQKVGRTHYGDASLGLMEQELPPPDQMRSTPDQMRMGSRRWDSSTLETRASNTPPEADTPVWV
jgi:hypothetical protein